MSTHETFVLGQGTYGNGPTEANLLWMKRGNLSLDPLNYLFNSIEGWLHL